MEVAFLSGEVNRDLGLGGENGPAGGWLINPIVNSSSISSSWVTLGIVGVWWDIVMVVVVYTLFAKCCFCFYEKSQVVI